MAIRNEAGPAKGNQALVLAVLCGAMFLDSMDVSLVAVALPSIESALGVSETTLQWLVSGYVVAYGGLLLLGGRTADRFGRRRVFLVAMVVFAVASLAGGLVTDGTLLVVTRVLKGVAAAFTAPAALSIITTSFREGAERNRALGVYSAAAAGGYSIGLVLSGVLTQIEWRLVFFVPAAIAVVVAVVGARSVRPDRVEDADRGRFDAAGAITVTVALLLLVYGLEGAAEVGWASPQTLVILLVVVLLFVAFVVVERRHPNPTVPLRLFRSVRLSSANLLAMLFMGASIGWQFVATLYLQQVLGYDALTTALALLPMGVTVILVAQFVTVRILTWIGPRVTAVTGMVVQASGIGLFALAGTDTDYATLLLPALLLHGVGNGLVFPTMNIAGLGGVVDREQGLASGLITASAQVGAGIGVAVIGGVATVAATGADPAGQVAGHQVAFAVGALVSCAGLVVALFGLPGRTTATTDPGPGDDDRDGFVDGAATPSTAGQDGSTPPERKTIERSTKGPA